MKAWVNQVESTLSIAKDDQNSKAMKAYMRGQFEFLGIQSTPRRAMLKELFASQYLPKLGEVACVVDELWARPEREYQLVAIDLLIKSKKKLPAEFFEHVERWITTKSWWDTVDMLATHIVGALASQYPDAALGTLHQWRKSDDICCAERRSCTSLSTSNKPMLNCFSRSSKRTNMTTNFSFRKRLVGLCVNTPKPMRLK